jgi:hypothetical protein
MEVKMNLSAAQRVAFQLGQAILEVETMRDALDHNATAVEKLRGELDDERQKRNTVVRNSPRDKIDGRMTEV